MLSKAPCDTAVAEAYNLATLAAAVTAAPTAPREAGLVHAASMAEFLLERGLMASLVPAVAGHLLEEHEAEVPSDLAFLSMEDIGRIIGACGLKTVSAAKLKAGVGPHLRNAPPKSFSTHGRRSTGRGRRRCRRP